MDRPSLPRTRPSSRTTTPDTARRGRSNQGQPRPGTVASRSKTAPERERAPFRSTSQPDQQPVTALWERYHEARDAGDARSKERLRNELVEHYLPLVKNAAERLLRTLPKSLRTLPHLCVSKSSTLRAAPMQRAVVKTPRHAFG